MGAPIGLSGCLKRRKASHISKLRESHFGHILHRSNHCCWRDSYDAGIQTYDTANVYSNGLSEIILGKAIKQHNLPQDEIVVMTKVRHFAHYKCAGLKDRLRYTASLLAPIKNIISGAAPMKQVM